MQRLQKRPVHPSRGLHDDPFRPAVLQDAGDLAEAVLVVGGGFILAVQVNVERLLAHVDSVDYDGHVLPLLSSR